MTEQSDKPSVDGLMDLVADALRLILPMAKGYAAAHPVGANAEKVEHAEAALAALAGPLEQPLEPTSDQANLAQASGGEDLQTALPYDITVGGNTFRKGVALSTFILAAQHWHRAAFPDGYTLTREQKARRTSRSYRDSRTESAANLAQLQGLAKPAAWDMTDRTGIKFSTCRECGSAEDVAIDCTRCPGCGAPIEPGASAGAVPSDKPAASSESSVSVPKEQQ